MCFRILYNIYLTRLGRSLHNRQIAQNHPNNSVKRAHLDWRKNSNIETFSLTETIRVLPVPYLDDNLAFVVYRTQPDGSLKLIMLVDPGDFQMVMAALDDWQIKGQPEAILTTHKHHDHAGNNDLFANHWPGVRIVGGRQEGVFRATHEVADGE